MANRSIPIVPLSQMVHGQEADVFVLLTAKAELLTREGKKYFRVTFRDADREVSFPIWGDAPLAADCQQAWLPGSFYKLRAVYRETSFGPQLDIQRIRDVTDTDAADGFDPALCRPRSKSSPEQLFAELIDLARTQVAEAPLQSLVTDLLEQHRELLIALPAAERNHHVYAGGWLEHTLSVSRTALYLADRYRTEYPDLAPPLDRDLVVAGAILHDIGKVRELEISPTGATTTAAGHLLGHIVQGRDLVREAAAGRELSPVLLLRLEHLILAHQPDEHGAPKPPMTPEALLVHYADDLDAKFHMMYVALRDDRTAGPVTSKKNILMRPVYRGPNASE